EVSRRDGRRAHVRASRGLARGTDDRLHDGALGAVAARAARQGLQPYHQRGARHQPRGVRHLRQAAGDDRVGMNGGPSDLAGQGAFNDWTLKYYDWLLEFACNRIWRCPIDRTLELYQRHLSSNHLEVGVGTGYFLDRIRFPSAEPRLALLDPNPHCLQHTGTRLARYAPEVYRADALAPIQ